jgi:hypothetical protein
MAIIHNGYDTPLVLRPIYNNFVFEFYSTTLTTPDNVDITIGSYNGLLSPNLDGKFKVNLSKILQALLNTTNFKDTGNLDFLSGWFKVSDNVFDVNIVLSINKATFSSDTLTVPIRLLLGVKQSEDDDRLDILQLGFDLFQHKDVNGYSLKYNTGYPFDIPIYQNETLAQPSEYITVTNRTTGNFTVIRVYRYNSFRLIVCDGKDDWTTLNLLPLTSGQNKIWLNINNNQSYSVFFDLEKVNFRKGTYLKWMNEFGAWNYWLFNAENEVSNDAKLIGKINKSNDPLNITTSKEVSMGLNIAQSMKVNSGTVEPQYLSYFRSLFLSPKVYLFTGEPFSQSTPTQWQEVFLTGKNTVVVPKATNYEYQLDLQLQSLNTMTI